MPISKLVEGQVMGFVCPVVVLLQGQRPVFSQIVVNLLLFAVNCDVWLIVGQRSFTLAVMVTL